MSALYHDGNRELQDRFDTRRLADRLEQVKVHDTFTAADREFIAALDMPRRRAPRRVPEAQFVVRVQPQRIYPNCPRYIHHYSLVERSKFVLHARQATPIPAWKQSDWAVDVLPANDSARTTKPGDQM